ncbi:MAG: S9 family peptidase [Bacteroidales bacterium]|nr:S9 family peptidase [Bacteroidales bacterium]HOI32842.1 S9 family peptidase [Bacteroidales bacterium]
MQKFCNLLILSFLIALISSCDMQMNPEQQEIKVPIGPQSLQLESDRMTPEVFWSFGRVGEMILSPDKKKLIYGLTYYSIEQNKGNTELYLLDLNTGNTVQLTHTAGGEYNPSWRPDGKKIGFLSAKSGSMQLWEMNNDGSGRTQITFVENGITGFKYAPDQSKILFTAEVKLKPATQDIYPDLPLTSGRINNDLMYRHWDQWVDTYSHVFVADYTGTSISNPIDLMPDETWETPLRPFGGMEQISWAPDSKSVVYCSRKKEGKAYSFSTNADIYQYNIDDKTTTNLTKGMMGYDLAPVFSPDGNFLAWESMERDGYEADKIRLMVKNLKNGNITEFTTDFDQNVHGLQWSDDGSKIYFVSNHHALDQIYSLDLKSNEIKKITEGIHSYTGFIPAGDQLIATRMSMSSPVEIFKVDEASGKQTQLTFVNKATLDQLTMGKVEERWIETSDGKQMLTWVIYPPHFDPNKKYPALLYCQGGPQSTVSQFWSYRWNFQMMAANDYIIVAPNRRGLPGFGQEWNEQISGDYGGQNMRDYLAAIDALAKEPFIDEERMGAVGASYGGFSVFWLAGNHEGRFKTFIAHDGMFNLEAQYLETEEMWFVNWDLGGPYWEKDNPVVQGSYANSPHRFVQNWDTPIMVVHSELDYRIVASQGMQAFNAAVLRDIPAEYLYFPDENHWVLKPQNGILWQRRFFNWLDQWLK